MTSLASPRTTQPTAAAIRNHQHQRFVSPGDRDPGRRSAGAVRARAAWGAAGARQPAPPRAPRVASARGVTPVRRRRWGGGWSPRRRGNGIGRPGARAALGRRAERAEAALGVRMGRRPPRRRRQQVSSGLSVERAWLEWMCVCAWHHGFGGYRMLCVEAGFGVVFRFWRCCWLYTISVYSPALLLYRVDSTRSGWLLCVKTPPPTAAIVVLLQQQHPNWNHPLRAPCLSPSSRGRPGQTISQQQYVPVFLFADLFGDRT